VSAGETVVTEDGILVRARIHDRISPLRPSQFQSVVVRGAGSEPVPMRWYGEYLWAAVLAPGVDAGYVVCATDAAGLETCAETLPAPA
jgi:hypothetical protein